MPPHLLQLPSVETPFCRLTVLSVDLGGLIPEPGGKFRLRLQINTNFVGPVLLARVLGKFKSKSLEEEVSARVNLVEEGVGKLPNREEGGPQSQ